MKQLLLTTVFTAVTLFATVSGSFAAMPESADKAAPAMNMDEATFLKVVQSANAFEIESSKLAEQKAKDPDVKEFARQMIADHTKAADALKSAAKMSGDMAPKLSPKHAAMLEVLKGASDQDFQPLYIDMQAAAHMEAVSLFATYAKGGDEPATKAFASTTLPTLEMHKMHVGKLVAAH